MMMPLITPMKCPKCSGTKWSSSPEIVPLKGLEKITIEELKNPLLAKRKKKAMIKEYERIMDLQAQVKYTCESCGHVLGTERDEK